jgi:hypothetical protein
MESAIKHPQAPQGAKKSGLVFWDEKELLFAYEERSWRCCGNRTATINAGIERRNVAK